MSKQILKEEIRTQHLIMVDLDGTILNKDFTTLNKETGKVLKSLQDLGHRVCIITGRNYLSALPFYEEMDLNGFLVTYNGAFINHPKKDLKFVLSPIFKETVEEILKEKIIKENLLNVLIDREDLKTISTSDDVYYQQIFFNGNPYIKTTNIKDELGDCLQLVLEFHNDKKKIDEIITTLRRKYHPSITFYSGFKLKAEKAGDTILIPDEEKIVIKIRNSFASKGMATEWVASYHNIPLTDTIAFGNDINDAEMFRKAKGIFMPGSPFSLKALSWSVADEGVGEYLKNHFGLEK